MDIDERLTRYSDVLLAVGVQLQPGQQLAINAEIEHAPLARALADAAYRRGARYVDIWYWDPHAKRSRIEHAATSTLSETPFWLDRRYEELARVAGALITIVGAPEPDLLAGLDPARAGLDRMPALASRFHVQSRGLVSWTFAAYPTEAWAKQVFGVADVEALWSCLAEFCRLDEPDPVAAWNANVERLRRRAGALTARRFDEMRLSGPGTDLRVGLIGDARWEISELPGPHGHPNLLNIPTEEVYTTPHHSKVTGTVRSTRPLALGGAVVEGLELDLTDGRIGEVRARRGRDTVVSHLSTDAGARRLGEIALVDDTSPIGRSGHTFYETLLDENATCHLAWGDGIPSVLDGWRDLDRDALFDRGVNQSRTHIDFMVGGAEVTVTGHYHDGRAPVTVLADDRWQLTEEPV